MHGKINIDHPTTHALPTKRIDAGFGPMHRGKSTRSVVVL